MPSLSASELRWEVLHAENTSHPGRLTWSPRLSRRASGLLLEEALSLHVAPLAIPLGRIVAGEPVTNFVSGRDGDPQTLTLGPGEYITSIEAHTGEKDGRKRISFIKFTTNKNNYVSGGTLTDDIGKEDAPEEGYQIGGFFGKRGDEIDSVAAIWATILP
ncbi:hypothetical protein PI126_g10974 [Phytophthora idaei]|nr:hypothetical protein PI126_g10974 [Phytophthora idaei]